jgi:exonuclease III
MATYNVSNELELNSLTISAWNLRSLTCAKPYMLELMQMSDVFAISEHRLYPSELYRLENISTEFVVQSKSSADLNDRHLDTKHGHCGVALFWNKAIAQNVRNVKVNSDRICAIEIIGRSRNDSLFIISVYMPQHACKIAKYEYHVNVLNALIQECKQVGEVVVIGDMNCRFSSKMGHRFSGVCLDNGKHMAACLYGNNMSIVDGLALCNGPCYTFCVEGVGKSYIDHVAVTEGLIQDIVSCAVHNDCLLNTSDHLPISVTINRFLKQACKVKNKCNIAWHKLTPEHVKVHYTDRLEKVIESAFNDMHSNITCDLKNIENAVDRLSQCMRDVSETMPQAKRPRYLKPYWNAQLKSLAKYKKQTWYDWKQKGCPRQDDLSFKA